MFRRLIVQRERPPIAPDPHLVTLQQLSADARMPIAISHLNHLTPETKNRVYRLLIPPHLMVQFGINPITWTGAEGDRYVELNAYEDSNKVRLAVSRNPGEADPFFEIELQDNPLNGIDLNLLVLNDPQADRFGIDRDEQGESTQFGTLRRNRAAEQQAMQAGLAPGQIRAGLGASSIVFSQFEAFLSALGHHAFFLEPLTYASAWVFERRGMAYVRGHKLMDDIHREFQPGGRLHAALDGSTPFRQPEQAHTIRGRAWAIHDGLLETIGESWNGLRMVKQIGRRGSANTAPEIEY